MTDEEIAGVGSAFASYLGSFRDCFLQKRTATNFENYCRGLLSDLPRKSVEPIALASGTAVRTLQEFLVTANWDHERMRDRFQQRLARVLTQLPSDSLGTIGVIDETSCLKKGDQTPGVQRQYLGCVGKIDNGVVTVHIGVARGRFQALLDAELYLPQSWDQDRPRCGKAGIPDEVGYRAKWRIALDQLIRLHHNGVRFDWLVFDEGYGSKVPFLRVLTLLRQQFVAEVPTAFAVRTGVGRKSRRADQLLTRTKACRGRRYRMVRQTQADVVWRARARRVWVDGFQQTLVVAINEATAEVKYFLTNAAGVSVARILAVAFRRATIEQGFRLAKSEAGLTHYEGRNYRGLVRHLILTLAVLGFVSIHTDRLRGEKSPRDDGAGVSGVERAVWDVAATEAGRAGIAPYRSSHPLPPKAKRTGRPLAQETAA